MIVYRTYRFLLVAMVLSGAFLSASARAAEIPWSVRAVESAGTPIKSITNAQNLLSGVIASNLDVTMPYDVLNFRISTPSGGKFSNNALFPGISPGHETDFAIDAHGNVNIPAAGAYTFGVSSDDGFALKIGNFSSEFPGQRKAGETYATFNFNSAGIYPVNLVFFQHEIAAELELFASPGNYSGFNQKGANFRLVGDVADGGLALANPGVAAAVPEPATISLLVLPMFGLLLSRRRHFARLV